MFGESVAVGNHCSGLAEFVVNDLFDGNSGEASKDNEVRFVFVEFVLGNSPCSGSDLQLQVVGPSLPETLLSGV
jgi:hypothetical protein